MDQFSDTAAAAPYLQTIKAMDRSTNEKIMANTGDFKSSFLSSQDNDALNRSMASVNSAYTLGHTLGGKNLQRKLSEPDNNDKSPLELKRDESSLQNFNGTPDLQINHTAIQPNFGQIQDLSAIEHLNQTDGSLQEVGKKND